MGFGFLKPTPVVLGIIIACLAIFIIDVFTKSLTHPVVQWGALMLPPMAPAWQVWRWITYQYLHGGVGHVFWNMLGLYFFGPPLERYWGSRKFFLFYTFCGVIAGLGFAIIQTLPGSSGSLLVGASGSILGCLAACAVLFPSMTVILILFPVPIRVAAVLFAVLFSLYVISEHDLSNAAHLAGMAAGVGWIWAGRRWPNLRLSLGQGRARTSEGTWDRKMRRMQEDEEKVDRILDKIRKQGMGSLTWLEKRFLKQASERRRQFDEQQSRRY